MTHIKQMRLVNWLRFRGEHVIDLEPGVYAVVARHEQDVGRSNWLGKTSFLTAIPFALYGWHTSASEDDWITQGELHGSVELVLSTGLTVKRERKLGKSTQLVLSDGATKDAAQERILKLVGLGKTDFFNTCFIRQKQMAQFITAQPADRMKTATAWFGLEPLQRCEERARKKLTERTTEDASLLKREDFLKQMRNDLLAKLGSDKMPELKKKLVNLKRNAKQVKAEYDEIVERRDLRLQWEAAQQHAARFKELDAAGRKLSAELKQVDEKILKVQYDALDSQYADLYAQLGEHHRKVRTLALAAGGRFDGACPVVTMQCPAAKEINAKRAANEKEHAAAQKQLDVTQEQTGRFKDSRDAAADALADVAAKTARLDAMREEAMALKAKLKQVGPEPEDVRGLEQQKLVELGTANIAVAEMEHALNSIEHWSEELKQIDEKRAALRTHIEVDRAALVVFGRNGAQRRIAEQSLQAIEAGTNQLLVNSGIDLEVAVQWSREGDGLAAHCDACGAPYPSSQKVKTCERCNALRGPKLVEKLEIELSDRSGAAEDIAGMGFYLAASRWLRMAKGIDWSVACIDEPFGALDETNRQALSVHLATMLRSDYGFVQSFVVAHDRSIMDALPNRVEIVAGESGSKFG